MFFLKAWRKKLFDSLADLAHMFWSLLPDVSDGGRFQLLCWRPFRHSYDGERDAYDPVCTVHCSLFTEILQFSYQAVIQITKLKAWPVHYKHLGTTFDHKLTFETSGELILSNCQQHLFFLRKMRKFQVQPSVLFVGGRLCPSLLSEHQLVFFWLTESNLIWEHLGTSGNIWRLFCSSMASCLLAGEICHESLLNAVIT